MQLTKKQLFNPEGDVEVTKRRMIGGNTTNLNDFNNMKYQWVSSWYRQAMNNFWVPEMCIRDMLCNIRQDVPAVSFCASGLLGFLQKNTLDGKNASLDGGAAKVYPDHIPFQLVFPLEKAL